MKAYSFGTFVVDDFNRQAFETCRAVAHLQHLAPMPILLLADKGCGKTHLLYSIVNRVRSSSDRIGLAYVTATDFPPQVRVLISDPSPVERAQSAILLVNQLDQFTELVEELEAIVRIFLDNGHAVVLASSVHPGRLRNLTPGLRQLIEHGQIVEIMPQAARKGLELLQKRPQKDTDVPLADQRDEIRRLRAKVAELEQKDSSPDPEKVATLEQALAAERNAKETLVADYEKRLAGLREQLDHALEKMGPVEPPAPRDTHEEELEHLRAEVALLAADARTAKQTRRAYEAMREKVATLEAQLEQAQGQPADDLEKLQVQLDEARKESTRAKDEAKALLARAESLVQQMDANRRDFEAREQSYIEQVQQLQDQLDQQNGGLDAEAVAALEAEFDQERAALTAELETLRDKLDEAQAEQTRTNETLAATETRVASLQTEVESLRAHKEQLEISLAQLQQEKDTQAHAVETLRAEAEVQLETALARVRDAETARDKAIVTQGELQMLLDKAHRDQQQVVAQLENLKTEVLTLRQGTDQHEQQLEAVRDEAAQQVATSNAQLGQLENQINELNGELAEIRETNHFMAAELRALATQLFDIAEGSLNIAAGLAPNEEQPAPPDHQEGESMAGLHGFDSAAAPPASAPAGNAKNAPKKEDILPFDVPRRAAVNENRPGQFPASDFDRLSTSLSQALGLASFDDTEDPSI